MKPTKVVSLVFLVGSFLTAAAEVQSPNQALERLKKQGIEHSRQFQDISVLELVDTVFSENGSSFYVFSDKVKQKGFVILSADDQKDVLVGYSDTGSIEPKKMPEALKVMIGNGRFEPLSSSAKKAIAPMLTTKWNQGAPYNSAMPSGYGEQCLAGCVGLAMSQIVRFHRYPESPVGVADYYWAGGMRNYSVDFSEYVFDFDNMIDDCVEGNPTDVQIKAVSDLIYCCASAVCSDWGISVTTSDAYRVPGKMKAHFGYAENARLVNSNYFTASEWVDVLYSQLEKGLPVLISANKSDGPIGHAFVCDGYDGNGYFHINWGWGGQYDGYFNIMSLYTYDPDVDYSSDGFGTNQNAIINLYPQDKTVMPDVVCTSDDFRLQMNDSGREFFVICRNRPEIVQDVKFGVKLTSTATGETIYVGNEGYVDGDGWMQNIPEEIESGEYKILPAIYACETETWQDIYLELSKRKNMVISIAENQITLLDINEEDISLKLLNPVYPEAIFPYMQFSASAELVNESQNDISVAVKIGICSKQDDGSFWVKNNYGASTNVKIGAGETRSLSLTCNDRVYYYGDECYLCFMQFVNDRWVPIGEPVYVPVEEYSAGTLVIDDMSLERVPSQINPTLTISAGIHCEGGYYNGEIYMDLVECDAEGNILESEVDPSFVQKAFNIAKIGSVNPEDNDFSKMPKTPVVTIGPSRKPIKISRQEEHQIKEHVPEGPSISTPEPERFYRVVYYYTNPNSGDGLLALLSGMILGAYLWEQLDVPVINDDAAIEKEAYYNLNGVQLSGKPSSPGVYILSRGNAVTKKIVIR